MGATDSLKGARQSLSGVTLWRMGMNDLLKGASHLLMGANRSLPLANDSLPLKWRSQAIAGERLSLIIYAIARRRSGFWRGRRLKLRVFYRHVEFNVGEPIRRRAGWRRGDDGERDFDAVHFAVVREVNLFGQRPQH